MTVRIERGRACGTVPAPPSKSMAHRTLICAALAEGVSAIDNVAFSDDISATINCLVSLGAKIQKEGDRVILTGIGRQPKACGTLGCHESGSTLRFLIPLCLDGHTRRFTGSERLFRRPLGVYESLCNERGYLFRQENGVLTLNGVLTPGSFTVPGDISSQFVSGLMFALCGLDGDSTVEILPPVESRPYIGMTSACLCAFGADIAVMGENRYCIKGNRTLTAKDMCVEGDWSQAAFFKALNLCAGNVSVTGLNPESLQGDRICEAYFRRIAAHDENPIDLHDCPDLAPIMFTAASLCGGASFVGTERLKIKESDRGAAMTEELAKCGIICKTLENRITVSGQIHKPHEKLFGHNDHRIVMALSVLLTATGGEIVGAEAVSKSYPNFFEVLRGLGIGVNFDC